MNIAIEVEGVKDVDKILERIKEKIALEGPAVIRDFCQDTSEGIKVVFDGNLVGFKDRTGALRRSIVGDLLETKPDIVGFVGAGDDNLGSNNKPTREYVAHVEYGEFTNAGKTGFLRLGVELAKNNLIERVKKLLNPENLVKK